MTHICNLSVLAVQNNAHEFEAISRQLSDVCGTQYRLVHCASLYEAQSLLLSGSFDAILLDLSLPDSVGLNTVSHMRNLTNRLPIVLLINTNSDAMGEQAIQQGAQEFLCKDEISSNNLSRVIKYAIKRKQMDEKLEKLSTTDPITGLYNRRYFFERGWNEYVNARHNKQTMAIVLIDIDHFKKVNEFYGHVCGDKVLLSVGNLFQKMVRGVDLVARFGAEEFIILMPNSDQKEVDFLAERIRLEVADTPIEHNGKSFHITASIGVAMITNSQADFESMIKQADLALSQAQDKGGNAVERFNTDPVDDYLSPDSSV